MSSKPHVLIIGGGMIGVACAYYLDQQNAAVTLLERGEVASGCSHGNAGLICPTHSVPLAAPGVLGQGLKWLLDAESPFYIRPTLNPVMLSWLWRFQRNCRSEPFRRAVPLLRDMHRASLELFTDVIDKEGINCHFEHTGSLKVYRSASGLRHAEREIELLANEFGLTMKLICGDEARQLEPHIHGAVRGALFSPEDAHLDPALFVSQLAQTLSNYAVAVHTHTEVLGFEAHGDRIEKVYTTRGNFEVDEVVLAAGAWSSTIGRQLGLTLPMQPAKGYSLTFHQPGNEPLRYHVHCGESRVVATPMGPNLRFAGTMELVGFDSRVNQRRVRAIRRTMNTYFHGLDDLKLVELWRGFRPVPPDGLPYIGRAKRYRNLVVASGHSYLGISLGPVTGKVVSQLLTGEKPCLNLEQMSVDRFA